MRERADIHVVEEGDPAILACGLEQHRALVSGGFPECPEDLLHLRLRPGPHLLLQRPHFVLVTSKRVPGLTPERPEERKPRRVSALALQHHLEAARAPSASARIYAHRNHTPRPHGVPPPTLQRLHPHLVLDDCDALRLRARRNYASPERRIILFHRNFAHLLRGFSRPAHVIREDEVGELARALVSGGEAR